MKRVSSPEELTGEENIPLREVDVKAEIVKMKPEKESIVPNGERQVFVQVCYVLIANLVNLSPGMGLGFTAVALPALQNETQPFHVDNEQASWIASMGAISTPFGCLITAWILDRVGRRWTLMLVNVPCLLGWLLIAFANGDATLYMIYLGRVFTGLATGMSSVPGAVFCAEISTGSLRGMFVTWTSIAMSLGILLVYILGYFTPNDWKLMAGVSSIFPAVAFVVVYLFLPESPSWLLSKGKNEKAEMSMKIVRGIRRQNEMPAHVVAEYNVLEARSKEFQQAQNAHKTSLLKRFFRKGAIKPFIIMNLFFFFQQFSGIFVIVFYTVKVVEEAKIPWDPYIVTIGVGLTRVIVTVFMSYISKRYGRRPPAIVSGAGMTICMAVLATYLYLKSTNKISEEVAATWSWIPVTFLILYILTSTIGFLTLPWAMIGEIFPSDVRGLAAGTTTCIAYVFNFIIVKVYPNMVESLSEYGVFFFYGACSVIGTIFVVIFLPETHGKTLIEIEESFSKKKSKKLTKNDANLEAGLGLVKKDSVMPIIIPKKS